MRDPNHPRPLDAVYTNASLARGQLGKTTAFPCSTPILGTRNPSEEQRHGVTWVG